MTAYDILADLAERELELVTAGALDGLAAVHAEREAVVADLPPRPPAEARAALERAAVAQARVTTALELRKRELAAELGRLGRGRTAVRGYTPPLAARRQLDRSG
jgi:hypothetical protein